MEMHQLRYFIAVAEELHFGRAALRENVSQPPLSLQIKKLEEELGVPLFERTKRLVSLTEAGAALLPTARSILLATREGKAAAQKAHRGETGTVTIGFVHSASIFYLPSLIGPFRRAFPAVSIELRELAVSDQMRALVAGTIDLGIIRPPALEPEISSVTVLRENFAIAVHKSHRFCGRKSVRLSDLRTEDFVFYPKHRSPAFYEQLIDMCASADFIPHVTVEANTMYTAVGLAGTGAGIAIIPKSVSAINIPSVEYIDLITNEPQKAELCLAYRSEAMSRSALSLFKFAKAQQQNLSDNITS